MSRASSVSSVLVKPVSADCNLACKYCFYLPKSKLYPESERHQMSERVLRELIAQFMLLSWDRVSFCWQGGEPTLAGLNFYKQVVKYQSLFWVPGQLVENSLQTNGVLIDREWARFLARYRFLVGVSLDGPEKLHNYYRRSQIGHPTYHRVMKGVKWLKMYNVDFNVLVLLNDRNVEHPEQLYRFLLGQGFRHLQFIPCVEKDPETARVKAFSVTPEQYGRFLCRVFDEWTREGVPRVYVRELDDLLIAYVAGDAPSCPFSSECGRYLVVEYNGDVYPCDFYVDSQWLLGNLTEQRLEEIIRNRKFAEFKAKKLFLAQKCHHCSWWKYCRGACPRHWYDLGLDHNYFCISYRMLFEHAHRKLLDLKSFVQRGKGADAC